PPPRGPPGAPGPPRPAAGAGRGPPPAAGARSAVSATMADWPPAMRRTAASAALRTGSQRCTAAASTLIEKNTLPSPTTTSDSTPACGSGFPSGAETAPRAPRTCSFVTAMSSAPGPQDLLPPTYEMASIGQCGGRKTVDARGEAGTFAPADRSAGPDASPADRSPCREETMAKVAFLGLGVMGYPMAGHLKNKGGHEVTVYNRTAAKADQWVKEF